MTDHADLLDRISTFQRHISETPPDHAPDDLEITLRLADHPALLVAGHAAAHVRAGEWRRADALTGPLVLEAARIAKCSALVVTQSGQEDANTLSSPRIRSLLVRLTERRPVFVLDVHGMRSQRNDVDLYISAAGGNAPAKLVAWIAVCADRHEISYEIQTAGSYAGAAPERLARLFLDSFGIPALQIEFAKSLRQPRVDPVRYAEAIAFLAEVAAWPDPEVPGPALGDLADEA